MRGAKVTLKSKGGTGSTSHFAGTRTCGKIHLCPVCEAKIRRARAEEIDAACAAWEAAGHGVAMMTLTMRHYERQALGSIRKGHKHGLVAIQHDAWSMAFGRTSGHMWQDLMLAYGIVGYVRAWEVTYGSNGWNPHFHVLLFLHRVLTDQQAAEFEHKARKRWIHAVESKGGYRPNDRGLKVDLPKAGDAGQFGRYLMKNQDGKARFTALGKEIARGDAKTSRRGRMPFEIAEGAVDGVESDVKLWREYEPGSHGIRAIYWSNGMRALLGELVQLDDREDGEVAAEEAAGIPIAEFPRRTWYRYVITKRGRALKLIKAAELGGQASVRSLIESWGLVWGIDVLEPRPDTDPAADDVDQDDDQDDVLE